MVMIRDKTQRYGIAYKVVHNIHNVHRVYKCTQCTYIENTRIIGALCILCTLDITVWHVCA